MARRADSSLTRIEILLLSALARQPMSGYDLKLELRYKHVHWWAKVEHGHLYAALLRLEKRGSIKRASGGAGPRNRRVYSITIGGARDLKSSLAAIGESEDGTRFDVDLFLQGMHWLDRDSVLKILHVRRHVLAKQLGEAETLTKKMAAFVPLAGRLIMDHRVEHLRREMEFCEKAQLSIRAAEVWGAFLRDEAIGDFVKRTGVPLERGSKKR